MNTTLELRKEVKVFYYELTKTGLILEYSRNGAKQNIELDILQTVKLLRQAGLIDSFERNRSGRFYVSYETEQNTSDHEGNHVQCNRFVYGPYEDFVLNISFSQYDALTCAIYAERNRHEKEAVENICNNYPKAAI